MAVMKQIDDCLKRAFKWKKTHLKSKKWKGVLYKHNGDRILYLLHYHHTVLVYNVDRQLVIKEWWEKPADKRGLDSAKEWLENYHKKQKEETS